MIIILLGIVIGLLVFIALTLQEIEKRLKAIARAVVRYKIKEIADDEFKFEGIRPGGAKLV